MTAAALSAVHASGDLMAAKLALRLARVQYEAETRRLAWTLLPEVWFLERTLRETRRWLDGLPDTLPKDALASLYQVLEHQVDKARAILDRYPPYADWLNRYVRRKLTWCTEELEDLLETLAWATDPELIAQLDAARAENSIPYDAIRGSLIS